MLANLIRRLTLGVLATTLCWSANVECLAQQPPSTRYQPVGYRLGDEPLRQPQAPPSVHIPPTDVQNLPARQARLNSQAVYQSGQQPQHQNASDAQTILQTSFQDPARSSQEPAVPEILQRTRPATIPTSTKPPLTIDRPPVSSASSQGLGLNSPASSPAQFASQLNQLRQAPPVEQKPDERLAQMKREFEELQQKAAARVRTANSNSAPLASSSAARNGQSTGTEFSSTIPNAVAVRTQSKDQGSSARSQIEQLKQNQQRSSNSIGNSALGSALGSAREVDQNPSPAKSSTESVRDFLTAPNRADGSQKGSSNITSSSSPSRINDSKVLPTSMQDVGNLPSIPESDWSAQDGSAEQNRQNSAIRLSAPSISVESFGPKTIGVNKPAIYKVVATNETNRAAERVVVSIDLPIWVEIDKVNLTAGDQQTSENTQLTRLMWKIDQIPGNGSQTITITAIPTKAEPFDLGIEWTIAPRAGTASIQVTQPKLEMSIVGPEEVQFGETAPYEVTVRNVGNGAAENVIVMLSEALNGDRQSLGDVPAGGSKVFTVNLEARTPGELELAVSAIADNQAETTASRKLVIRRANLGISISGPSLRYAGTTGEYTIKLSNTGDATAEDVVAALGLPTGVKFLGGIEGFKLIDGGLRWQIGRLEAGQVREYKATCQFDAAGDVQMEVGTQAAGALQASHACVTKVQTIADLVMQVNDPPGPLTTGDEITYEINIVNRGTKSAKGVDIFMILSEGMEPKSGTGLEYRIPRDGALQFATIPQIDPGQKITLKVNAVAYKPGTHVFRAHLVCEEADAREIKEGTSRFFGDEVSNPLGNTADENSNFKNSDFKKSLK